MPRLSSDSSEPQLRRRLLPCLAVLAVLSPAMVGAQGAPSGVPAPPRRGLSSGPVERLVLPKVDPLLAERDDEARINRGQVTHYAVKIPVAINPWNHGTWELVGRPGRQQARWRLHLVSNGALSLNLGFSRYRMPLGGSLTVKTPDGRLAIGPFTERDNETHNQLWTPPLLSSELLLELILPLDRLDELELELIQVNHGYAGFGDPQPKSGACNLDVACSAGDLWHDQARAVALLSIAGVRFCTGFLVNNTAHDGRPFLITAHHCDIKAETAPSVVVLWNQQSPNCRSPRGASDADLNPGEQLRQFQTGATLRAAYPRSDALLLELDDFPDPSFNVFYAGWDRSGAAIEEAVAIHHPNTDWKRISFDSDPVLPTAHLQNKVLPRAAHLRVGNWELGTTEGGSSGAPLFDQNHRVVGQLHGGYAACGNRRGADWFGRFATSWSGGGRPGTRFSDWLDPLGSDALTLDGIDGDALRPVGTYLETAIRPASERRPTPRQGKP